MGNKATNLASGVSVLSFFPRKVQSISAGLTIVRLPSPGSARNPRILMPFLRSTLRDRSYSLELWIFSQSLPVRVMIVSWSLMHTIAIVTCLGIAIAGS
jgi:hypothetical protein